ncbi:MAG: response regulator [Magnetococcales bacterium]|nr:response regulator [Magnetococcales bacterium]
MNHSIRILLIDDNPSDSRRLVRLLGRVPGLHILCRESHSSQQGQEDLVAFDPDLVFVDYLLDDNNGLELIRRAATTSARERAFILLTGQGDEEVAVQSLRAGVLDYLTKNNLSVEILDHTLRFVLHKVADRRALHYREAILHATTLVAEAFLKSANWRQEIDKGLEILGQAADVSRAFLFENAPASGSEHPRIQQRYEWVASGSIPSAPEATHAPEDAYRLLGGPHWVQRLKAGHSCQGVLSEWPVDATQWLQRQGIQSIVLVPVFVDGQWWGVLGLDERHQERNGRWWNWAPCIRRSTPWGPPSNWNACRS